MPDDPVPITATRSPREVDRLVRPLPGVEEPAAVVAHAGEVGRVGRRQAAGRHHHEPRRSRLAGVGGDAPRRRSRRRSARSTTRVSNVMSRRRSNRSATWPGVPQDLGLRGVPLGPLPLLLEVGIEPVRVLHALDVAARARVPVPVPRAADVGAGLEHPRPHPEPARPVQHVHPGEPGPHDHHVDIDGPNPKRCEPSGARGADRLHGLRCERSRRASV